MDDEDLSEELDLNFQENRKMMIPRYIRQYKVINKVMENINCVIVRAQIKEDNSAEFPYYNETIVLKIIRPERFNYKEALIMNLIYHQNIINFLGSFEYKENNSHFYVISMALAEVDLIDYIYNYKPSEHQVARVIYDVLGALSYLHSNNIIHRDVKPDNILIIEEVDDEPLAALSDFGLSVEGAVGTVRLPATGTIQYAAPELIEAVYNAGTKRTEIAFKKEAEYSCNVDIWSLGVTLYSIVLGNPFTLPDGSVDIQSRLSGKIDFEILKRNNPEKAEPIDLISKMMNPNPNNRISAKEAREHVWFRNQQIYGTPTPQTTKISQKIRKVESNSSNLQKYNLSHNGDKI